jgi:CBS-domain-containing membrane protein
MARCAPSWRNPVRGHVVSALVRVTAWKRFQHTPGLAESVAVATAIAVMYLTRTLHSPRGETAPIVGIGSDESHALSYVFVVIPSTVGPLLLLLIGLLVNNIPQSRCCRRVGFNGRVPPMRV